jgi:hypothetical protein
MDYDWARLEDLADRNWRQHAAESAAKTALAAGMCSEDTLSEVAVVEAAEWGRSLGGARGWFRLELLLANGLHASAEITIDPGSVPMGAVFGQLAAMGVDWRTAKSEGQMAQMMIGAKVRAVCPPWTIVATEPGADVETRQVAYKALEAARQAAQDQFTAATRDQRAAFEGALAAADREYTGATGDEAPPQPPWQGLPWLAPFSASSSTA